MKLALICLLICAGVTVGLAAQATTQDAAKPANQDVLSPVQREGRRIFQQKCATCHVPIASFYPQYGPALSRASVDGREPVFKLITSDGTERMPGFKYTLRAEQIDAVASYLKTLDRAARTVVSNRPGM